MHHKGITLVEANHKKMMQVEVKMMNAYQMEMMEYIDRTYPEIGQESEEKKVLTEELIEKIELAAEEFKDKSRC